jgi:hypothetical protein
MTTDFLPVCASRPMNNLCITTIYSLSFRARAYGTRALPPVRPPHYQRLPVDILWISQKRFGEKETKKRPP